MNVVDLRLVRTLAKCSCAAAILSVAVGCVVLGGWIWDVAAIKSVLPGLPTMKANTAICFVLGGLSLFLWQRVDATQLTDPRRLRRAALACSAAATVIAVATLGEHLLDWNIGIDELIIRDTATSALDHPGRMSMASALNFVLIGSALSLLGTTRRTGLAQGLAAAAIVVSLTALLAYLLQADLQRAPWFATVALHTAATFLVLSAGVLNLRTQHGWMRAFVLDTVSGGLGRRFLAGTLMILPLLAAMQVLGQRSLELYGPYFAIAILSVTSMTLLSLLNWFSTSMGNDAEEKISHLNRIYATLSGINTLIVRVRSREQLFSESCRIARETGRFPWVWIATVDGPGHVATLVASQGGNDASRDGLQRRLSSNPGTAWHGGLARRAIATKAPVIVNDIASVSAGSDNDRGHNAELLAHGIRALVLLPLIVSGEAVAIFALHADEEDFFDEQEMKLLTELAGDIGFALDNIQKDEALDYLAYYDSVTGLANRTLFVERLGRELSRKSRDSERVALVLGDLKRFRMINETFGRNTADELLKQVAARLQKHAQYPENLARLSGDCFATYIPITRHTSVAHRIEGLLGLALDAPFTLGTQTISVEATLGIAIFPADGADAEILVTNAEAALKAAKEQGEPYLFYKPEINAQVAESLRLENRLRDAVELDQFVLHYQPKVDFRERSVDSVEALIRWNDPQSGLVPPGRFIGLLEETGLIKQVGRWALQQAVADSRRWTSMGLRAPRCAVNVSAIQLRDPGFVSSVVDALDGFAGAEPLLDIELTESLVMTSIAKTSVALMTLRGVGVQIAVDDFGTGYSSLAYLARLPINALKIDRSFINAMVESREGSTIVQSIISLAHSLRLEVIAEGVETEQQADALREMGCDLMQGYLFSKPVLFEQLAAMLPKA